MIVACGLGPCGLGLRGLRHDFGGSHDDGAPPYVVKWSDGHEGLYFPGSDASVVHHPGGNDA